ncbi:MAG TPA: serine/threonine protein kinase [Aggregatilineaceae bacterium]|nr:serine/threonine protein kinase [Aggregatilineaceae bacterium]
MELAGQLLGQYRLLEPIGKGGMAVVYRAQQAAFGREVAIKILGTDLVDDVEFSARFRREAETIANLQHPHILPVIDYGEQAGLIYLVMRLIRGGTLASEMAKGPLSLRQTAALLTQIASALTYAHSKGVIHRDFKPQNVLLDEEGNSYLTDFGIAKMLSGTANITSSGHVMGTPSYMAPEQWRAQPVDARTDIYALGLVVYEMLVGLQPFDADTPFALMYSHLDMLPASPTRYHPTLPGTIEAVVFKAIAKHPADRYSSAQDFADAFRRAVTRSSNPDYQPKRPTKRYPATDETGAEESDESTYELRQVRPAELPDWAQRLQGAPPPIPAPYGYSQPYPRPAPRRKRSDALYRRVRALLMLGGVVAVASIMLLIGLFMKRNDGKREDDRGTATLAATESRLVVVEPTMTPSVITSVPEGSDTPSPTNTIMVSPTVTPTPETCLVRPKNNVPVNIRNGPGTGYDPVGSLQPDDPRPALLHTSTGFVYMVEGWVDDLYVVLEPASACASLPLISLQDSSAGAVCTIQTTQASTDLRFSPDPDANRFALLYEGTPLTVFRVETGSDGETWYYGATDDGRWRFGWVSSHQAEELTPCSD